MTSSGADPESLYAPGDVVADRFRVEHALGRGGMGDVYAATQLAMGRRVALKILRPGRGARQDRAAQRFVREMKVTARVRHPNTVEVFDFGVTEQGDMFLAMELLDGCSLTSVIREEAPLDPERIAHIGALVARALAAAHAEGIVHRDLKPQNIFLVDRYDQHDFVKVLDFGIARFSNPANDEEAAALTSTGMLVGTPLYLAPEYIARNQLDHRSDLYSLGVLLFQLATGEEPFDGPPGKVLSKTVHAAPPSPSAGRDEPLPGWLERCILSLLAKEPEDRPPDAQAVVEILEHGLGRRAAPPTHSTPPSPPVRRSRRWMLWVGLAALALVLVASAASFAVAWMVFTGLGGG